MKKWFQWDSGLLPPHGPIIHFCNALGFVQFSINTYWSYNHFKNQSDWCVFKWDHLPAWGISTILQTWTRNILNALLWICAIYMQCILIVQSLHFQLLQTWTFAIYFHLRSVQCMWIHLLEYPIPPPVRLSACPSRKCVTFFRPLNPQDHPHPWAAKF